MPPRSTPTARQQRLGSELRKLRERAGLSSSEAAIQLGIDRARISNTEAGRFGVSPDRVRAFARILGCADEQYIEALAAMAADRVKGWWEEYREDLPAYWLDLAELEYHATTLHSVVTMHMPGLLQTEEYAKSVFATAVPELAPAELRRRLSHRMKRRDILDREDAPQCVFLVHEAALRMQFGGREVARAQLIHLAEASERQNITVRTIPFSAGGFPNAGNSMLYAGGAVPRLDTVQLDAGHGSVMLDAETHLDNYRAILNRTKELAMNPEQSCDLILEVMRSM